MATEVEKIVDPDNGPGTNYTSLNAFESGEERDLTSDDEIAIATCRCTGGTADTADRIIFAGWTADATRYIKIQVDSSYKHNAKYETGNIYRIEVTTSANGGVIEANTDYMEIYDILMKATDTGGLNGAIEVNNDYVTVANCVLSGENHSGASSNYGIYSGGSVNGPKIYNNIVYKFNQNDGRGIFFNTSNPKAAVYNNTVYSCSDGFRTGFADTIAKNNVAQVCSNCYNGIFNDSSEYNCSDDDSQPGDNGQNGSVTFVDESGNDFRLDSSDTVAKENGTDLSADAALSFSIDIVGTSRPQGTEWDMGAFEYASVTPTPSVARRYRMII